MDIFLKIIIILILLLIEIGIGIFIFKFLAEWLIFPYILFCLIVDIPLVEIFDET